MVRMSFGVRQDGVRRAGLGIVLWCALVMSAQAAVFGDHFVTVRLETAPSEPRFTTGDEFAGNTFEDAGQNAQNESFFWGTEGHANLSSGEMKGRAYAHNYPGTSFFTEMVETIRVAGAPLTSVEAVIELEVSGTGTLNSVSDGKRLFDFLANLGTQVGAQRENAAYTHRWELDSIVEPAQELYFHNEFGDVEVIEEEKGEWRLILRNSVEVFLDELGLGPNMRLAMSMEGRVVTAAGGGASVDAMHTASARIVLPDGYSFESASGTFLTAPPPTTVPVPAALPLLAGACGLVALRRRPAPPLTA